MSNRNAICPKRKRLSVQTGTGGAGADRFGFVAGGGGGTVTDFSGAAGQGDTLGFYGYGADAAFTKVDATHWQVSGNGYIDVITLAGAPKINMAADIIFS